MHNDPLVSIIVLSYNYAQFIGATIRSVIDQGYQRWELIVSDDASHDESLAVVHGFDDPRITLLEIATNTGASANYARAYARCRGSYILSLDADDALGAGQIAAQVDWMESHPEADILGTYVVEIGADGLPTGNRDGHEAWFNSAHDLNLPESWAWQNRLCHSSALIRKPLHDRVGLLRTDLIHTPDYEFWLRCLLAGARFAVLPEPYTQYRSHGGNITYANRGRAVAEQVYLFITSVYELHRRAGALDSWGEAGVWWMEERSRAAALEGAAAARLVTTPALPNFEDWWVLAKSDDPIPAAHLIASYHQRTDLSDQRIEQLQRWIADLERGKLWLEQQLAEWQRVAEKQAAEIEQFRGWLDDASHTQAWLEQQRANWESEAHTALAHLAEQQVWSLQLESGKIWLEDQRASWEREAQALQRQVNEQQAWIETLEIEQKSKY